MVPTRKYLLFFRYFFFCVSAARIYFSDHAKFPVQCTYTRYDTPNPVSAGRVSFVTQRLYFAHPAVRNDVVKRRGAYLLSSLEKEAGVVASIRARVRCFKAASKSAWTFSIKPSRR